MRSSEYTGESGSLPYLEFVYPPRGRRIEKKDEDDEQQYEPLQERWLEEMLVDVEQERMGVREDLSELQRELKQVMYDITMTSIEVERERKCREGLLDLVSAIYGEDVSQEIEEMVRQDVDGDDERHGDGGHDWPKGYDEDDDSSDEDDDAPPGAKYVQSIYFPYLLSLTFLSSSPGQKSINQCRLHQRRPRVAKAHSRSTQLPRRSPSSQLLSHPLKLGRRANPKRLRLRNSLRRAIRPPSCQPLAPFEQSLPAAGSLKTMSPPSLDFLSKDANVLRIMPQMLTLTPLRQLLVPRHL